MWNTARDPSKCCGSQVYLSLHHLIPVAVVVGPPEGVGPSLPRQFAGSVAVVVGVAGGHLWLGPG